MLHTYLQRDHRTHNGLLTLPTDKERTRNGQHTHTLQTSYGLATDEQRNHRTISCHEPIHLEARVTAPSVAVTRTVAPGGYFPAMIARATGVSTSRWIARFTGRAP